MNTTNTTPLIRHLKNTAKRLRKSNPELQHSKALDLVAQEKGYANWRDVLRKEGVTA